MEKSFRRKVTDKFNYQEKEKKPSELNNIDNIKPTNNNNVGMTKKTITMPPRIGRSLHQAKNTLTKSGIVDPMTACGPFCLPSLPVDALSMSALSCENTLR